MADLYQRLELTHRATTDQIRASYRRLAKRWHPDVCAEANAEERFIAITEAYEILIDPVKRAYYDRTKESPSPKRVRRSKQARYERKVRNEQQKARRKASSYSKESYENFQHSYFDSPAAYYAPKFLGCFGIGIVGMIVLTLEFLLLEYFDLPSKVIFPMFFVSIFALIIGGTWASVQFDSWHNAWQRKRKKK